MDRIILKETTFEKRFEEYTNIVLEGGYVFDDENKQAIERAVEVLRKNRYGLFFVGNPGSGKTLFLDIAQRIIDPTTVRHFITRPVLEVVLEFNRCGENIFQQWKDKNVFFDDLYKEDKGQFYNDKNVEVMERFINLRYNLFRGENRILTHFTTNHSKKELNDRYGLYCMTRLEEMCELIPMGAKEKYTNRRAYKNFNSMPFVHYPKKVSKEDLEWKESYEKMRERAKNNPSPKFEKKGIGSQIREMWDRSKPKSVAV